MERPAIRPLLCVLLLGLAAGAAAESLADVAKRDAERRAKQKSDKPVKSYGEQDLSKAKGGTYTQIEASDPAPVQSTGGTRLSTPVTARSAASSGSTSSGSPSSSSSSSSPASAGPPSSEAAWRSQAKEARDRVARLEKEVQDLDAQAARSAFGSQSETCIQGDRIRDKKDEKEIEDCLKRRQNDPLRQRAEHGQLLERLAKARSDLAQAKRSLENLEEGARRTGVPPGWLRD